MISLHRTLHPTLSHPRPVPWGAIILQKCPNASIFRWLRNFPDDILRDGMHKTPARLALAALLAIVVVAIAMSSAAATFGFDGRAGPDAIGPQQGITPTPVETPTSVVGSTDSIMWMGVVIVLIALLPLLTRPSFWP
jgi:hypothetical protein